MPPASTQQLPQAISRERNKKRTADLVTRCLQGVPKTLHLRPRWTKPWLVEMALVGPVPLEPTSGQLTLEELAPVEVLVELALEELAVELLKEV